MSQPQRPGPRVPQVNLFAQPSGRLSLPLPGRFVEMVLIGIIVVVWAAVGIGIALLFGWHPNVGVSL
jgi:hypothetical protein